MVEKPGKPCYNVREYRAPGPDTGALNGNRPRPGATRGGSAARIQKGASMKTSAKTGLLRRATALALAVVLSIPSAFAAAGDKKIQTSTQLVSGLSYQNTVTANNGSRVESFSLELEPGAAAQPILLQSAGTVYGAATINKAVSRAESLGYHVLGAINTDFFATSTGVPMGIVIEDGDYQSSPENEAAMTVTDGKVQLVESPKIQLTLTNQTNGTQIHPQHLNKVRAATGGMYLMNRHFSTVSTRTSTSGWYVRMKLVDGSEGAKLALNTDLTLQVTEMLQSSYPLDIGEDEYVLTADDASGYLFNYQTFAVGDKITLRASCDDETLSNAQWAGGVGDIMVKNGSLTDSSKWNYVNDGRAPRTALGVKADGTLLVYAVDGRQSGYSIGLSQKDLAEEMRDRGCQWVVNLDGGGSTAISVWYPGQSAISIKNIPSDGRPRSCATYLLLVADEKGDGVPTRLALKEEGQTVLTGSEFTLPGAVALDKGLYVTNSNVTDVAITSGSGLGTISGGVYTAGGQSGVERLQLSSPSLGVTGTSQLNIVSSLTVLTVSKKGSSNALTSMTVKPGDSVQLAIAGSYWGRTALRSWKGVSVSVSGDVGTVDENGLFTAGQSGGSGTITVAAGGQTKTVKVTVKDTHADVPQGHWAYEAVEYCYEKGIVGGVSANEFGRDYQIRRGDFMLMLYNAVGRPAVSAGCTFTDVSQSDYYYKALSWAQSAGLASGTGDGSYSPTSSVTREQAFTILRKAMPLLGKTCPDAGLSVLDAFSDKEQIADYAKGHTATLVAQGVVSGKGTGIDPKGNLTRAEMAALLYKLMTYTPITDVPTDPMTPDQPSQPDTPETPDTPDTPVTPDQPDTPDTPAQEVSLTLDVSQLALNAGESRTLIATLSPEQAGAVIVWSCDSAAAAVAADGTVTNLNTAAGTVQATITATWSGKSASCTVDCQPAQRTGTVFDADVGLNVRSGPGTTNPVVDRRSNGDVLIVESVENGWCKVLYRNAAGQAARGYVSADYLQLSN